MKAQWIDVRKALPWLQVRPPYFVNERVEHGLLADLAAAGFMLRSLDGSRITNEPLLLASLGEALGFPDHYGRNWDAYIDCIGDVAESLNEPLALVWTHSDRLLAADAHAFVRAVHIILDAADSLGASDVQFQFELFLLGSGSGFDAERNGG